MSQWHQTYSIVPETMREIEKWFDVEVLPLFDTEVELKEACVTKLLEEVNELLDAIDKDYSDESGEIWKEAADVIVCLFLMARGYNHDLGQIIRQKASVVVNRPQELRGKTWHHRKTGE